MRGLLGELGGVPAGGRCLRPDPPLLHSQLEPTAPGPHIRQALALQPCGQTGPTDSTLLRRKEGTPPNV